MIHIRHCRISLDAYGIDKWAYDELRAFCRQYPDKKRKADALIGIQSHDRTEQATYRGQTVGVCMSGGNGVGDPTALSAERRERYLADVAIIEDAARETAGGAWYRALVKNACYGIPYECINRAIMPTSNRNAFFAARREFFYRLYVKRYED